MFALKKSKTNKSILNKNVLCFTLRIVNSGASAFEPRLVERIKVVSGSLRAVCLGPRGVLQRAELLGSGGQEDDHLIGIRKHVENEHLRLVRVGLLGLDDLPLRAHVGDLLVGEVEGEGREGAAEEEAEGEGVDADVGRAKAELPRLGVCHVTGLVADLRVLDNAVLAVTHAEGADTLIGVGLRDGLGGAVRTVLVHKPDEGGVADLGKDVVDAVLVDDLDAGGLHLVECTALYKALIDAGIPVGGKCDLVGLLQEHLALRVEGREHPLAEEVDLLLGDPKELLLGKELARLGIGGVARHDVPVDKLAGGLGGGLGELCLGEVLDGKDPVGLDLKQRLLGGKAEVVHPLGVVVAEPAALAAGKEEDGNLPGGDEVEAGGLPLLLVALAGAVQVDNSRERGDRGGGARELSPADKVTHALEGGVVDVLGDLLLDLGLGLLADVKLAVNSFHWLVLLMSFSIKSFFPLTERTDVMHASLALCCFFFFVS